MLGTHHEVVTECWTQADRNLRLIQLCDVAAAGIRMPGFCFDRGVMCCGSEAGSYLKLIDSFITQLKAQ